MRGALKIAATSFIIFLGAITVYSIFSPYTVWFVLVRNSRLTVDGKPARGWLDRSHNGENLFVTRIDGGSATTYLVVTPHAVQGTVFSCGKWVAPRLPVFAQGDVNPPCWTFTFEGDPNPPPAHPPRKLTVGPQFVEFTADDGGRWKAAW